MIKKIKLSSVVGVAVFALIGCGTQQASEENTSNIYEVANAWKNTAAEYDALFYQAFNIAGDRIELELEKLALDKKSDDKKLAIISDVDDTLVINEHFWSEVIKADKEYFDDDLWDQQISEYVLQAAPGATEFLTAVADKDIEVFYVTSRNQFDDEEKTNEYAVNQLAKLGFPNADAEHVKVLMESSNKEEVQAEIEQDYHVLLRLGDNLNDFNRSFYVDTVDERKELTEQQKEHFGREYIVFPNPTDGHWVRTIFGESEPQASEKTTELWKKAGTGELDQ